MKLLTLILTLTTTLVLSQNNIINANIKGQAEFHKIMVEYRASNGLTDEVVLDTTGSAIIQHKSDWYTTRNSIGHTNDPNNSWLKCTDNAKLISNSGVNKFIERGAYEISQSIPFVFADTININDTINVFINSPDFWKIVIGGFTRSASHNSAMLDNTPIEYSMRAKEYIYYQTVSASFNPDATKRNSDGSFTCRIIVFSTITKMGHGSLYETDDSGHIIYTKTETTTGSR